MYDLAALESALTGSIFAGRIHFAAVTGSTNNDALEAARSGASHGSAWLADEQIAGRGRSGHVWQSIAGEGLYVSVLLRPQLPPDQFADRLLLLPLAAGLAAAAAIHSAAGITVDLRWPNDLLLGPRKFCGILTELNAEVTRIRHVVIGIGINVHQPQFPAELRDLATSLEIETGRAWPRQELLIALLQSLHREVLALSDPAAAPIAAQSILERLEQASSWVRGKRVRVEELEGFSGVTEGLDARGFLQVRTPQGLRTVFSGGVREIGAREITETRGT